MPEVTDIEIDQKFPYDYEFALELWRGVKAGTVSYDDLVTYLKRFVVIHLRRRNLNIEHLDQMDEVVHYSLLAIWEAAKKGHIPDTDEKRFHGYLTGVIRHSIAHASREGVWFSEQIKADDAHIHMSRYLKRLKTPQDLEDGVYLSELPGAIRERVAATVRFPVDPDAVRYVVDRLFAGQEVSESWLSRHYKISNPKFLAEHVRIRVKMSLLSLQGELGIPSLRSYRRACYESLRNRQDRQGSE